MAASGEWVDAGDPAEISEVLLAQMRRAAMEKELKEKENEINGQSKGLKTYSFVNVEDMEESISVKTPMLSKRNLTLPTIATPSLLAVPSDSEDADVDDDSDDSDESDISDVSEVDGVEQEKPAKRKKPFARSRERLKKRMRRLSLPKIPNMNLEPGMPHFLPALKSEMVSLKSEVVSSKDYIRRKSCELRTNILNIISKESKI
ncbi:unnamed protein product [Cylicostephanus goldi]|uniref:Uncharacterized protein n=1 Tax=Cylicostephanus goldi TaxID=71465 RepID=A0A3P6QKV5_CYLGO|nr:unnamed protein product [Cylicostephanus goldi]